MKNLNLPIHSPREGRESNIITERQANIVVGISSFRARYRVSVLLSIIPAYHVKYVSSEKEMLEAMQEADIIIGGGFTALEGVLRKKPVIVVGDYGFGGLITPSTFCNQYDNGFKGKINGMKDEYFSLELLREVIRKSMDLTFQELQMMSNQVTTFLQNTDF